VPIAYPIPTQYEFELYWNAADSVQAGGTSLNLTSRNINPDDLFGWARKQDEREIPEAPGSFILSDGQQASVTMAFFGEVAGNNPNDTFYDLTERMANIAQATKYTYIRAGFYDGSTKQRYRRYGEPSGGGGHYVRKTMYEAVSGIDVSFRATDPAWYEDGIKADIVTVTSGAGSKVITDAGRYRSKRATLYITRTGGTVPTNPTVSNIDGQSFAITGTLAAINDQWVIDMYHGTVKKIVSGVTSNDIANFSGRFFTFKQGTDTISVTSGASANFTVSLLWLEKLT